MLISNGPLHSSLVPHTKQCFPCSIPPFSERSINVHTPNNIFTSDSPNKVCKHSHPSDVCYTVQQSHSPWIFQKLVTIPRPFAKLLRILQDMTTLASLLRHKTPLDRISEHSQAELCSNFWFYSLA